MAAREGLDRGQRDNLKRFGTGAVNNRIALAGLFGLGEGRGHGVKAESGASQRDIPRDESRAAAPNSF